VLAIDATRLTAEARTWIREVDGGAVIGIDSTVAVSIDYMTEEVIDVEQHRCSHRTISTRGPY
jgi:hypothetical protein